MRIRSGRLDKIIALSAILWMGFALSSCEQTSFEGKIVMVQVPAGGSAQDDFQGSRLVLLDPVSKKTDPIMPSMEFSHTGSPVVSYDGKALLFEAMRNDQDHWQIWELDLQESKLRQITEADSDCRYPAYLPGGRIVYSRYIQQKSSPGYHVLETCQLTGENRQQITFEPVDYTNSIVLSDGRILSQGTEVYPEKRMSQLIAMRPDGTKKELFYQVEGGQLKAQRSCETRQGLIIFSESPDETKNQGRLTSIRYNRPLGSRAELIPGAVGDFISVNPGWSGELMLSFKSKDEATYGIYSFDPEGERVLDPIFSDVRYNIVSATAIAASQRPKKLPSAVDPNMDTALLMCQDANFSAMGERVIEKEAIAIELLGLEGSLGKAQLQEDGSVYLKVAADTPFRIQTIDSDGKVVQGPSSWMNLRPNERRGCVGCHAGHERVPANVQPLAVRKEPIEIPKYSEAIMANVVKQ